VFEGKTIMFVGAHPDDIELGCGAIVSRLKTENIIWVVLSDNQDNPANTLLVGELKESASRLGIKWRDVHVGNFKTREFSYSRQDICDYLYAANELYEPDIVFTHSYHDRHQDHLVVNDETMRVFRGKSVLGYEIQASAYGFFPNVLVEISGGELKDKIDALKCYKTNRDKIYFSRNVVTSQAVGNGTLIRKKYAEGFESYRLCLLLSKKGGGE
jgi:LmbE family N-acetylglucosaminyl deacetylase